MLLIDLALVRYQEVVCYYYSEINRTHWILNMQACLSQLHTTGQKSLK